MSIPFDRVRITERHIATYQDLFVHRGDISARQLPSGGYALTREPVTAQTVVQHLEGRITAGWYALAPDSTARWSVLDADSEDGLERLKDSYQHLAYKGIPAYLELSRRGGHLWTFYDPPLPAHAVRLIIKAALPSLEELELYPKQDRLDTPKAVGSLLRGPLGIHQLTGRRYPFADPISLEPVSKTVLGTIDFLQTAERVRPSRASETVVFHAPSLTELRGNQARERRQYAGRIAETKERLGDARAFISRFVPLDRQGKGSCPFHPPDNHPSFAVNPRTGRWTDFHEYNEDTGHYTSGDIVDFYMRIRGITLIEALDALKEF